MAGNASDTATDSYSGSGNDSWGQSQQGTTAISATASAATSSTTAAARAYRQRHGHRQLQWDPYQQRRQRRQFQLRRTNRPHQPELAVQRYGTGSTSLTENITDQSNTTTSSSDSWSDYQAGSFSANSLSLCSVSSSDSGSDSWSTRAAIPSAPPAKKRSSPDRPLSITPSARSGSATVSQSETVTLNDTVSGTDTASANDSYSSTGGDTYSMSEQGSYGNYSYSFGTVVLQGGGSYSGTFQSSSTDCYHGTSTTNSSDSQQLSSNTCLSLTSTSSSSQESVSNNVTMTVQDNSLSSMTQTGTGSYSYYQSGSYAGGSFAFGSVNYYESGIATLSGTETASISDTYNGAATIGQSESQSDATDIVNLECASSGDSNLGSGVMSGSDTLTESVTLSGNSSYSISSLGCYANYSYSLSSYVYSSGDSMSLSGQQTETSNSTWTPTGSLSDNNDQMEKVGVSYVSGGVTYSAGDSDGSTSTDSASYTETLTSTDTTTTTANQLGTFSDSCTRPAATRPAALLLPAWCTKRTAPAAAHCRRRSRGRPPRRVPGPARRRAITRPRPMTSTPPATILILGRTPSAAARRRYKQASARRRSTRPALQQRELQSE